MWENIYIFKQKFPWEVQHREEMWSWSTAQVKPLTQTAPTAGSHHGSGISGPCQAIPGEICLVEQR